MQILVFASTLHQYRTFKVGGGGETDRQTDRQTDRERQSDTQRDRNRQIEETEKGVCYSDSLHRIHDPLESRDVLKRARPLTPGCSVRC